MTGKAADEAHAVLVAVAAAVALRLLLNDEEGVRLGSAPRLAIAVGLVHPVEVCEDVLARHDATRETLEEGAALLHANALDGSETRP